MYSIFVSIGPVLVVQHHNHIYNIQILQEEKENVLSETTRLNNELKDRRKSRVASQTVMESSLDNYKERIVALQKENEENLEEVCL